MELGQREHQGFITAKSSLNWWSPERAAGLRRCISVVSQARSHSCDIFLPGL